MLTGILRRDGSRVYDPLSGQQVAVDVSIVLPVIIQTNSVLLSSGEILFCIVVMVSPPPSVVLHRVENAYDKLIQVISVWLEGSILGTLLNYLVDKDPVAQAHKRNVEELSHFIEAKLLPPETASRLFMHVEFQYQKTKESLSQESVHLPRHA